MVLMHNGGLTTSYSYGSIPLSFADTVFPITYCSNYGLSAASNTMLTAQYYHYGSLLTTQTANIAAMPLAARDGAVAFPTGYKPGYGAAGRRHHAPGAVSGKPIT
jgi:hypothetical protein